MLVNFNSLVQLPGIQVRNFFEQNFPQRREGSACQSPQPSGVNPFTPEPFCSDDEQITK